LKDTLLRILNLLENKIMQEIEVKLDFTGEYFIPGKSGERIEADHIERYRFACKFAKGKTVLDIACGVGYSGPMLIEAGALSYDGVDINEKLIEYAGETYGSDSIKYFLGDICKFSNGKMYDMITCYETIEHVEHYERALQNLYSLLKPGGNLFISSPNRTITSPNCATLKDKPSNEFHVQEFVPEELLIALNENGFIADKSNLYGQRQRKKVYKNRYWRKIIYALLGNPDINTSPKVTQVNNLLPRYFVIVATKN
jgi:2-polyprenyl-3-methyl-5-hydroxy-6-metoxy-1,4-benzoquinol methylase